jgi:hypothetical protein
MRSQVGLPHFLTKGLRAPQFSIHASYFGVTVSYFRWTACWRCMIWCRRWGGGS